MKYSIAAAVLATFVTAQDLSGIPQCAQGCLNLNDLGSLGCGSNFDVNCICRSEVFVDQISCCVSQNCDDESIQQALEYANNICAGANVQLPTSAGCSSSGSASPTPTSGGGGSSADSSNTTDAPEATGTDSEDSNNTTGGSGGAAETASNTAEGAESPESTGGAASFGPAGAAGLLGLAAALL